jgi:hypothetical protein
MAEGGATAALANGFSRSTAASIISHLHHTSNSISKNGISGEAFQRSCKHAARPVNRGLWIMELDAFKIWLLLLDNHHSRVPLDGEVTGRVENEEEPLISKATIDRVIRLRPFEAVRESKVTFSKVLEERRKEFDPEQWSKPLREVGMKEVDELIKRLQPISEKDSIPSFVKYLNQRKKVVEAHENRKQSRGGDAKRVTGRIDALSLLELASYRERMKVQAFCRLIPAPQREITTRRPFKRPCNI